MGMGAFGSGRSSGGAAWLLFIFSLASRSGAQPVFPRPALVPLAERPGALISGDWNGDGRLDIAVLHPASGKLSVLLNAGSSEPEAVLGRPRTYSVGLSPLSVDAGDLDRKDGLDLFVTSSGSSTATVLLNRGDGTFDEGKTLDLDLSPRVGRLADLDSDGKLDAVVGTAKSKDLLVFLGDGRGGFGKRREVEIGGNPHAIAVEDFDGDGVIDVTAVYANSEVGGVQWLRGIGDGRFDAPERTSLDEVDGAVPRLVAPGDFDGDGLIDMGVATDNELLLRLRFQRGGAFDVSRLGKVPAGDVELLRAADFDADGRLDLIVPLENPGADGIRIWKGEPSGNFSVLGDVLVGGPLQDALILDLDGDGVVDFIGSQVEPEGILVVRGTGPGRLGVRATVDLGSSPKVLKAVDLDGDSALELLAVSASSVHFVRPTAAGSFERRARRDFGGRAFEDAAVLSVDGGVRSAIALLDLAREDVLVLPLGVDGPGSDSTSLSTDELPRRLAAADLDGDGSDDIAISHIEGAELRIFFQPAAEGAAGRKLDLALNATPTAIDAGDLDGDGLLDLAVGTKAGLTLLLNEGEGHSFRRAELADFKAPTELRVFGGEAGSPARVALAISQKAIVLLAPATEVDPEIHAVRFDDDVEALEVADVTGDGEPDLLCAVRNAVLLSRGNPERDFGEPESYPVGSSPRAIVVGVFEPLGRIDCATADAGAKGLSILHGTALPVPPPGRFLRGDSDGDGRVLITDPVLLLSWLFRGGPPPVCADAADTDDSGDLNLTDAINVLEFLFRGGPPPAPPGPRECGPDVKPDDLPSCGGRGC